MPLTHSNPSVQKLIDEVPIRHDLTKLPLDDNPTIASSQVYMRRAVPIPLSDTIPVIRKIKHLLKKLL